MSTRIGLWLDHRKAVIVALTGDGEETTFVNSHAEKQPRRSGGSNSETPHGPQSARPDDKRESAFTGHLAAYFDVLIARLRQADAFFIFGPGEAKEELVKRINRCSLGGRISSVETAGRMSDPQIAAKVRKHFAAGNLRSKSARLTPSPRQRRLKNMSNKTLFLLAASLMVPVLAPAQAPTDSSNAVKSAVRVPETREETKQDIKDNDKEIASDEGKLKDSHADQSEAVKAVSGQEKSDLASATGDKSLTVKQKKSKKAGIRKGAKAQRKAVNDKSTADRQPLEKDVRLDKANIKDDQQRLGVVADAPKP